jgi:hypothetical protein
MNIEVDTTKIFDYGQVSHSVVALLSASARNNLAIA